MSARRYRSCRACAVAARGRISGPGRLGGGGQAGSAGVGLRCGEQAGGGGDLDLGQPVLVGEVDVEPGRWRRRREAGAPGGLP